MGFTTEYSQFYTSFRFPNNLISYAQIIRAYPQSILSNEKRVGKNSISFPTRCVNLLFTIHSYPHVYNVSVSFNTIVSSTNFPWRYTFTFSSSPISFSLYKCFLSSIVFSIF